MLEISLKLIVFLFPLVYSPGPGNMFFAANGARFGFRSTLMANSGYHMATWIVTIAFGLGLGALLQFIPYFLEIIRYAGAMFVFYLAWKLYRSGTLQSEVEAKPAGFWDGVIILILNPKAYMIIAILCSQFLTDGPQGHAWMVLFVSTVFVVNNFIAFSVWALIGDRLVSVFKSDNSASIMNEIFGITLASIAIWMLIS